MLKTILGVSLVMVMLVATLVAPAAALSTITLEVSPIFTSAVAAYTLTFTLDLPQPPDTSAFVLTFPPFANIAGVTGVAIAAGAGAGTNAIPAQPASFSISGQTLTINTQVTNAKFPASIGSGATVQIIVNGVINPAAIGNYVITVKTAMETTPRASSTFSTVPGAVSKPALLVSPTTIGTAAVYTITFTPEVTQPASPSAIVLTFPPYANITRVTGVTIAAGAGSGTTAIPVQPASFSLSGQTFTINTSTVNGQFPAAIGAGAIVQIIVSGVVNPSIVSNYGVSVKTAVQPIAIASDTFMTTNITTTTIPTTSPTSVHTTTTTTTSAVSTPGVTLLVGKVNSAGIFAETVTATSNDAANQGMTKATVTVTAGTKGLAVSGGPLTQISVIRELSPPTPPVDGMVVGSAYNFGPDGAQFDKSVTVTITYTNALSALPQGVVETSLYIAFWDQTKGTWVKLPSIVNTVNKTVSAQVTHFSQFEVLSPKEAAITTTPANTTPTANNTTTTSPVMESTKNRINWGILFAVIVGSVVSFWVFVKMVRKG